MAEEVKKASEAPLQSGAAQWKRMLAQYLQDGSFHDADRLARRLLECGCVDPEVQAAYQRLQDWKYMDVRNGVLVAYGGRAKELELPTCIVEIEAGAFEGQSRLVKITLPGTVERIGSGAFRGCRQLRQVIQQGSIESVAKDAFSGTPYDPAARGLCLHCGGTFSLLGNCKDCGRKRDYEFQKRG
jgi:hypothetical protein